MSQPAGKVVCSDASWFVCVNMAGEVVVDALPYIDQGYDEPGVREAVGTNVHSDVRSAGFVYINLLRIMFLNT